MPIKRGRNTQLRGQRHNGAELNFQTALYWQQFVETKSNFTILMSIQPHEQHSVAFRGVVQLWRPTRHCAIESRLWAIANMFCDHVEPSPHPPFPAEIALLLSNHNKDQLFSKSTFFQQYNHPRTESRFSSYKSNSPYAFCLFLVIKEMLERLKRLGNAYFKVWKR